MEKTPCHSMSAADYESATGAIDYTLTNDFMFHVLLQENEIALRGLCSAILHLAPDELMSVEIQNPISLSDSMDNKTFILDVRLLLNNNTMLNLEMQVINYPAIHVGILDFDLFPDAPEFYARNLLMNVRNHKIFTTKFRLNVLCLRQIERATEEDCLWHIDQWAKLFKATTWEELKMIAENDAVLESAGKTLFNMNSDSLMREKARAREDYERNERTHKKLEAMLRAELAEQKETLAEQEEALTQKDAEIAALRAELERYRQDEDPES